MPCLRPVYIAARDLPDAWFQCVSKVLEPGLARKRKVDEGSFKGEYRLELDWVDVHVHFPGTRPLIPDMPPLLNIPAPVENQDKVDKYFARYVMSGQKEGDEQYTYGERLTGAQTSPILHIKREHTYFEKGKEIPPMINQVEEVIRRYKEFGPGNNQLIMQVGQPADLMLKDPPCLRHIDTRIEEGKLHFSNIYFRSWDLWGGLPENLPGFQMLKEYMAQEIGVEDGEIIFTSKGLHLYGYAWEIAGIRRGMLEAEMAELRDFLKKNKAPEGCEI